MKNISQKSIPDRIDKHKDSEEKELQHTLAEVHNSLFKIYSAVNKSSIISKTDRADKIIFVNENLGLYSGVSWSI